MRRRGILSEGEGKVSKDYERGRSRPGCHRSWEAPFPPPFNLSFVGQEPKVPALPQEASPKALRELIWPHLSTPDTGRDSAPKVHYASEAGVKRNRDIPKVALVLHKESGSLPLGRIFTKD